MMLIVSEDLHGLSPFLVLHLIILVSICCPISVVCVVKEPSPVGGGGGGGGKETKCRVREPMPV